MINRVEKMVGGRRLALETGRMARQAHGSALVQYGETTVLVAVVESPQPKEDVDFLPLFVDYRERSYAGGKIPGGFFKREGRPSDREILAARLIDRPIRPLFPDGYHHDVMVMVTVLSSDQENPADVLGLVGASAALGLSQIPVSELISSVRVGYIDGEYVVNPNFDQIEQSELNLIVAGTSEAIVMVEGGADEVAADVMSGALKFAHARIKEIIEMVAEFTGKSEVAKREFTPPAIDSELRTKVEEKVRQPLDDLLRIADKQSRQEAYQTLADEIQDEFAGDYPEQGDDIRKVIGDLEKKRMREMVIREGVRLDGRKHDEIREITCEVDILPRVHGSALFTRGQTQALASVTLGTSMDSQVIDGVEQEEYRKSFMLHYNFPSFSVGEVRIPRGPGRREIGHGHLAERALFPVIPEGEDFPYTIRLVSDILESNGSSSMASVCGGSLAMMDAGVPIRKPVAGIAMGLIYEEYGVAVLSDILGAEDHLGDMDFKVAGTRQGITAFQLDSKIGGIPMEVLDEALERACKGYNFILDVMDKTLQQPRESISPYAPRIHTMKIDTEKIRDVIGPGGKMIRKITEESGAKIDIEDDGTVTIASADEKACEIAIQRIRDLTQEPEIGRIYDSVVKTVTSFGAFVEYLPGREGLVHISALEKGHVKDIDKAVKVGDKFKVKLIDIDKQNRVRLSKVAAEEELEKQQQES